jgi:hypothetical protein
MLIGLMSVIVNRRGMVSTDQWDGVPSLADGDFVMTQAIGDGFGG